MLDTVLDAGFDGLVFYEVDELCGLLCAHVDDGIWAGRGPKFTKAQAAS